MTVHHLSLDDASRLLQHLALSKAVSGVEMYVRADGRVEFRFGNNKAIHADLLGDGSLPLPSVAIAEAVK